MQNYLQKNILAACPRILNIPHHAKYVWNSCCSSESVLKCVKSPGIVFSALASLLTWHLHESLGQPSWKSASCFSCIAWTRSTLKQHPVAATSHWVKKQEIIAGSGLYLSDSAHLCTQGLWCNLQIKADKFLSETLESHCRLESM